MLSSASEKASGSEGSLELRQQAGAGCVPGAAS